MTTKIYAPDSRANGESYVGPHVLTFADGVAETDQELSDGALAYMQAQGYGINGPAAERETVERVDSRDHADPEIVGTPLRDAAVDPRDEDFLAPVNAGRADPQGPQVVSPTIHASGVKAVVPGPVGASTEDSDGKPVVDKDTDTQDVRESDFAEATLVEQTPVPEATVAAAKVDPINEDAKRLVEDDNTDDGAQDDGDSDDEDPEPEPTPDPAPKRARGRKA